MNIGASYKSFRIDALPLTPEKAGSADLLVVAAVPLVGHREPRKSILWNTVSKAFAQHPRRALEGSSPSTVAYRAESSRTPQEIFLRLFG